MEICYVCLSKEIETCLTVCKANLRNYTVHRNRTRFKISPLLKTKASENLTEDSVIVKYIHPKHLIKVFKNFF